MMTSTSTLCPACRTPVLWAASPARPVGTEGWCPRCGLAFAAAEEPREAPTATARETSGVVVPLHAEPRGMPYQIRELPTGHIDLAVSGPGPWRLSPGQARGLGEALIAIATYAELRTTVVRGSARWGLRRRGEVVHACHGGAEHPLVSAKVVRVRWKGWRRVCAQCEREVPRGEGAHRTAGPIAGATWFCGACVEAAPVEGERGHLRLVGRRESHPDRLARGRRE